MCVYLTYVLPAHTADGALSAAGAAPSSAPQRPRSGQGDVLPVPVPGPGPASPPILTCHCPPILPAGIGTLHSLDVSPLSPQRPCGVLAPSCAPRLSGFDLCWEEPCAGACSRLPVLHCGSFISSYVLINQLGPLPAGSNPGWVVGEAPWEWEGACGKHSCAQESTGTYPKALGACAMPDSGPKSLREGAFECTFHTGVRCGCRVSPGQQDIALQGQQALQGAAPTPQQMEVLPDPFPHL